MKRKQVLAVHPTLREKEYRVLHRSPQLPGDAEFAVARNGPTAQVIALFFSVADAQDYAQWKQKGN